MLRASRQSFLLLLFLVLWHVAPPGAQGQRTPDGLWTLISPAAAASTTGSLPSGFGRSGLIYELDVAALLASLPTSPGVTARIHLPATADEQSQSFQFEVRQSPIAPEELAAYAGAVTYEGRGIEDPRLTTRFIVASGTVSGIVIGPDRSWIVNPLAAGPDRGSAGALPHLSLTLSDIAESTPGRPAFPASWQPSPILDPPATVRRTARPAVLPAADRTFRLAVGATPEFVDAVRRATPGADGFSDDELRRKVLFTIMKVVNNVQAIYQRELGIRFQLVLQTRHLIAMRTNPYGGASVEQVVEHSQAVMDGAIPDASGYDLGHVFTAGWNTGLAAIACACDPLRKAMAASSIERYPRAERFELILYSFATRYVAHEIGHQLNGRHTFAANGERPPCNASARAEEDAYEPGSGSTMMSYAGFCWKDANIADRSGLYFHAATLQRIAEFVSALPLTCGTVAPNGNTAPVIQPGSSYVLPARTPFVLRAQATDPDGDSLTYTWEEFDPDPEWKGDPSPEFEDDDRKPRRPLFRSYPPSARAEREIPRWHGFASIPGYSSLHEVIPEHNHARLNFRVTARDSRGGYAFTDIALQVLAERADGSAVGSFRVVEPDQNTRWQSGRVAEVEWDVAGTFDDPISCKTVRIELDDDATGRFAYRLADAELNDGKAEIVVPTVSARTNKARVRVSCNESIFYNVSPALRVRRP